MKNMAKETLTACNVKSKLTLLLLFTLLMRSSVTKTIEIDWTKLYSVCKKLINCFLCKMLKYYKYVWRYKEKGKLEEGYPVTIYQMFSQLPKTIEKIDAAYQRSNGNIVLFTGKTFWVHNGQQFIENSPISLESYGLPSYLDNIDAVQNWSKNRKTYFYKGDRFWRYNETAKAMDPGYPLHMERWRGVPENVDAATTWKDGATYFFKGELFWKFDNDWVIVTEQSPLPTAQVWFGCPEEEQKMIRLFPKE